MHYSQVSNAQGHLPPDLKMQAFTGKQRSKALTGVDDKKRDLGLSLGLLD